MTDQEFIEAALEAGRSRNVQGHVFRERLFEPADPTASAPVVAFDEAGRVRLIRVDGAEVVRAHRRDDRGLAGTIFVNPGTGQQVMLPPGTVRAPDPVDAAVAHVLAVLRS